MVITLSGSQQEAISKGAIDPFYLLDIETPSGTLRFCNKRAISYLGNLYQPFIQNVDQLAIQSAAPINRTRNNSFNVQLENAPMSWSGTNYEYLSHAIDGDFPIENSTINMRQLFTSTATQPEDFTDDDSISLIFNGVAGSPTAIDKNKMIVPLNQRNSLVQDSMGLRLITREEFPEADRDEVNGRTYIPMFYGENIRIRARAIGAGATTTVRTQVSSGSELELTDVTGFSDGDSFIIDGITSTIFTLTTVDTVNKKFTGISPDISTIENGALVGSIITEDKGEYRYAVANHLTGPFDEVRVVDRRGEEILVDASKYTQEFVVDENGIDGFRTDLLIQELTPIGATTSGTSVIDQQPTFDVDPANHNHNIDNLDLVEVFPFGSSTVPTGDTNINDGNEDSFELLGSDATGEIQRDVLYLESVSGTVVEQRAYAVWDMTVPNPGGTENGILGIAGGADLTLAGDFDKGEYRGTANTSNSDEDALVRTKVEGGLGAQEVVIAVFEQWKTMKILPAPTISERTLGTDITQNVSVSLEISGANIEVGREVIVTVSSGIQSPDSSLYGTGTVQRPDYVYKHLLNIVYHNSGEPNI